MSEERLARIESDLAAIKAMLSERCSERGGKIDDLVIRVGMLEKESERRKGGLAVLGFLCAASAAIGGLLVKYLPKIGV